MMTAFGWPFKTLAELGRVAGAEPLLVETRTVPFTPASRLTGFRFATRRAANRMKPPCSWLCWAPASYTFAEATAGRLVI
jgi:hypothetical protein